MQSAEQLEYSSPSTALEYYRQAQQAFQSLLASKKEISFHILTY